MLTPMRRLSSLIGIHDASGATISVNWPVSGEPNVSGATGGLGCGHHDDGRVVLERFFPAAGDGLLDRDGRSGGRGARGGVLDRASRRRGRTSAAFGGPVGDPVGEQDESLAAIEPALGDEHGFAASRAEGRVVMIFEFDEVPVWVDQVGGG